jgi:hypothetical protein
MASRVAFPTKHHASLGLLWPSKIKDWIRIAEIYGALQLRRVASKRFQAILHISAGGMRGFSCKDEAAASWIDATAKTDHN